MGHRLFASPALALFAVDTRDSQAIEKMSQSNVSGSHLGDDCQEGFIQMARSSTLFLVGVLTIRYSVRFRVSSCHYRSYYSCVYLYSFLFTAKSSYLRSIRRGAVMSVSDSVVRPWAPVTCLHSVASLSAWSASLLLSMSWCAGI